jgi:ribosomal protein S18 acetylase RimI-like enzyme
MEAVAELALDMDRPFVWLETMQKGPARHFYDKLGFRVLGETAVPYPEVLPSEKAMWIMGKNLRESLTSLDAS